MAVSDRPWGDFTQADYTPAQWARACLIDTGQGDPDSKARYKVPVREPSGAINRNGVHEAASRLGQVTGVSPEKVRAAARALVGLYRNDLGEDPPERLVRMAGMAASARTEPAMFARSWALEGIEILRSGKGSSDGRTVEAYAAVFGVPTEITDAHGHYMEVIDRAAFNRTLSHGIDRVGVYYHHGLTIHGTPSDLGSVPIGSPVDVRADGRGLRTVTRFNRSPLADSVLEAIRAGDIRGYSFRGGIFRSSPSGRLPRPRPGAALPTVTRTELGLTEYGPTPTPAYVGASIEALRSMFEHVFRSTPADQGEDPEQPATPDEPGPGAEDPPVDDGHSARRHLLRLRAAVRDRGM